MKFQQNADVVSIRDALCVLKNKGKNRLICVIFTFFTLCISANVASKQLSFNKTLVDEEYLFEYEWLDHLGQAQALKFSLPMDTVNDKYRHFKALKPNLLQMYAVKKLKKEAAKVDPQEGRVIITPSNNGIEFSFRSTSQAWMQAKNIEMKNQYEQFIDDYLAQEYYTEFAGFNRHIDATIYKPDHKRFALESVDLLKPVINAIHEQLPNASVQQVAQFMLGWIQTIPYDTIESRSTTNGAGFLPPNRLIANNIGDCDSKVTLMAALMKAFFPSINMAIIFVPEHALLAFHLSHVEADYRLTIDDYDYTLAEPVGPALIEFAKIADESQRFIESGYFIAEKL